jgi:F-type H+-transporting ATPase subunit b
MGAVLGTFGVDWRLLLINAINFGVLMLALWYFLYQPVTRVLEERREKVAKGVEDAQAAHEKLEEIEHSREGVLAQAGREADKLVEEARAAGAAKERELRAQGESAAQAALKEAQAQANDLKEKALEESKREVAKLIVLGIEKAQTGQS